MKHLISKEPSPSDFSNPKSAPRLFFHSQKQPSQPRILVLQDKTNLPSPSRPANRIHSVKSKLQNQYKKSLKILSPTQEQSNKSESKPKPTFKDVGVSPIKIFTINSSESPLSRLPKNLSLSIRTLSPSEMSQSNPSSQNSQFRFFQGLTSRKNPLDTISEERTLVTQNLTPSVEYDQSLFDIVDQLDSLEYSISRTITSYK